MQKEFDLIYVMTIEAGTIVNALDFNEAKTIGIQKWKDRFEINLPTYGFNSNPDFCTVDNIWIEEYAFELFDEKQNQDVNNWIHFLKTAIKENFNSLYYFKVFLSFNIEVKDPFPVKAYDEEDFKEIVKHFPIKKGLFDEYLSLLTIEDDTDKTGFWFNIDEKKINLVPRLP